MRKMLRGIVNKLQIQQIGSTVRWGRQNKKSQLKPKARETTVRLLLNSKNSHSRDTGQNEEIV